jgi:hypothetical protein
MLNFSPNLGWCGNISLIGPSRILDTNFKIENPFFVADHKTIYSRKRCWTGKMHICAKHGAKIRKSAFSKPKSLARFPLNPSNLFRGSSLMWRLFHERAHIQCLLFFFATQWHKNTMCAGFVIFCFILNYLCSSECWSNLRKPCWPPQNPIGLLLTLTPNYDGWI